MRYSTKMECAKYLNSTYGDNTFSQIIHEKNVNKDAFSVKILNIIKKEYDMFFDNMYKVMNEKIDSEIVIDIIKEFDILLDLFYSNSKEILKMYVNIFNSEQAYIQKFNEYDENLREFIVSSLENYNKLN